MKQSANLIRHAALLLSASMLIIQTVRAWYNPFAYDTSSQTSAFGTGLQDEKHEAARETARTTAEAERELHEGREAGQIESTAHTTTTQEKRVARRWETAGPQGSVRADDTRIASEIAESKASALGKSTR